MATSPSLTIGSISSATITDTGSTVSSGSISWSVAEQAESAFSATKTNYNTDTSGWSSRYYWSGASGSTSFNGLSNTVTVSTQVTKYTKTIVRSTSGTFITSYTIESDAQSACDNVAGSASYIYSYAYTNSPINGNLGYCVYRYDLSISTSSSTVTLTQNVDVSNYITVQSTTTTDPYVTGITMGVEQGGYNSISLTVGETANVSYSISVYNPDGVSFSPTTTVTNTSSSVASCTATKYSLSGTLAITALANGTTTITVSAGGKSATLTVTVTGGSSGGGSSGGGDSGDSGDSGDNTPTTSTGSRRAYIGVNGIARRIKKMYIGINTDVPVYETQTVEETITSDNITDFFKVTNGSYYFVGSGSIFTSNNSGVSNSTATTTLEALYDMEISFSYSWSSEANYDKFTLVAAGYTIESAVSGATTSKTWIGTLTTGQTIIFTYAKDSSANSNNDKCTFSDMLVTCEKQVQVDTVQKDVARRIKKAYIGIGGIARPCFTSGLEYYGTTTALSVKRRYMAATTVGNYALFGGGYGSYGFSNVVDAYDASLTNSTPNTLYTTRESLAATTVGNYALFGGGDNGTATSSIVDAYDLSLTKTNPTTLSSGSTSLAATTVGNYALFGGGYNGTATSSIVDAYDLSLTKTNPTTLQSARRNLAATTVGNYALFGGGTSSSGGGLSYVDAYDTSLTRTMPTALSVARQHLAATTVGDYALFGGGLMNSSSVGASDVVDVYDTSLTRTTPVILSVARYYMDATTVGDYALFGGGYIDSSTSSDVIDAYDTSLTRTTPTALSTARYHMAATTVGYYALFGGGYSSSYSDVVDVYTA